MEDKKTKKQIPVVVVSHGDNRHVHHSMHVCDMTRQLGRPIIPRKNSIENSNQLAKRKETE